MRALGTPGQVAGAATNNVELAAHQSDRPARPRLPSTPLVPEAPCSGRGRTAVSCPDNGSEFGRRAFADRLPAGVAHSQIRSGRPQTNGHVERLHRTILEECWRPAFARFLQVRYSGLKRHLDSYLRYYNQERAHTGRLTRGHTPADLVYAARKMAPR
ncbi:MAG: integrase core domain-containing protein [Candidatus Rokuibacteriota bacterium]